ncbi:MAG: hypothetical protein M1812_001182 [Candelaria pacifica]|nr:MAG: hypothetical protein M1812_001182 [Candelaria pacifica]
MPLTRGLRVLSRRANPQHAQNAAYFRALARLQRMQEAVITLLALLPEDAKPAKQGMVAVVEAVVEHVAELQEQFGDHQNCEARIQDLEEKLEEEYATGAVHAMRVGGVEG